MQEMMSKMLTAASLAAGLVALSLSAHTAVAQRSENPGGGMYKQSARNENPGGGMYRKSARNENPGGGMYKKSKKKKAKKS
jgi:hypothetical protein